MSPLQRIQSTPAGATPEGTPVRAYHIRNANESSVRVLDYGGIITSLVVPDRYGALADVVLGFDNLDPYLGDHPYLGALIGRVGNRIRDARFMLDGKLYQLAANRGHHHLHGGVRGFDRVVWAASPFTEEDRAGLVLSHRSPDGDEGYPGALEVRVTYSFSDENVLSVDYYATTDAPTHFNPTQHAYFNLAGKGTILDHHIQIDAGAFTEIDDELLPTGNLLTVDDTPLDLRTRTRIADRIEADHVQLRNGLGFDHNFVLERAPNGPHALVHAARVDEPASGRVVDVYTSEPGLQLYTGNFLDGTLRGKGGAAMAYRTGLCLETQHFPDSPNHPAFPSTRLDPGQAFRSRTEFRFSTDS